MALGCWPGLGVGWWGEWAGHTSAPGPPSPSHLCQWRVGTEGHARFPGKGTARLAVLIWSVS